MTSIDDDMQDEDISDRRPEESEEEAKARKRKERLEQNRISARESRKRKKTMIEELQRTVITLSRENKDLNERNEQLRRQLMEIGSKYPNIVPLQAIVGQGTAAANGGSATTASAPAAASTAGDAPTGVSAASSSANKAEGASTMQSPAAAAPGSIHSTGVATTVFNPMAWLNTNGNVASQTAEAIAAAVSEAGTPNPIGANV